MKSSELDIAELLTDTYRQQSARYANALRSAEELLANWDTHSDVLAGIEKLSLAMNEISHQGAAVEDERLRWLETRQKPGPMLARALDENAQLILRLKEVVGKLESLASQRKQRLGPEIDGLVRGHQMQRAYAAIAKSSNIQCSLSAESDGS